MRLRAHRRNLVVWSSFASPVDRAGGSWLTPPTRNSRVRRFIRTSALFTILGLMRFACGAWPRGRLVLAGGLLTVAGIVLRSQPAGVVLLPGLLLIFSAPLIPAGSKEDRKRNFELTRELAAYSTPAQRRDLEATLDQYPAEDTSELRAILAGQALAGASQRIAGAGRY
jgi:hypothetical protein